MIVDRMWHVSIGFRYEDGMTTTISGDILMPSESRGTDALLAFSRREGVEDRVRHWSASYPAKQGLGIASGETKA